VRLLAADGWGRAGVDGEFEIQDWKLDASAVEAVPMGLNDVDNLGADCRINVEANDKVLFEFWKVTLPLPNVDIGADVEEGLRRVADGAAELFEFEDAVIDIVAVVHGNVTIDWFGPPNLRRHIDYKRMGKGYKRRHRIGIGADISVIGARRHTSGDKQSRRKRKRGSNLSWGRMDSALEEAERHIVGSRSRLSGRRADRKGRGGGGGRKAAAASMVASRVSRVEQTIRGEAESSRRTSDGKVEVEGTAVHGVGSERDNGVEVA
jgi:hypothetical protein